MGTQPAGREAKQITDIGVRATVLGAATQLDAISGPPAPKSWCHRARVAQPPPQALAAAVQLMLSEEAVSSPVGPPGPGLSRCLVAEMSSQPSPRRVEKQNDFLNRSFPVESTFYASFPRSLNYQMFAFLRRPKIAEIWGI